MPPTFNLIDQPFLPCVVADGSREYGLKAVLLEAHNIREIRAPSPLVTLALHRLLLAILHRNFGPTSGQQWKALWDASHFPAEPLTTYLDRWRNRFDLFHHEYPFFQVAEFASTEKSGVNRLAVEIAETNVRFHFSHVSDDNPPALPPAAVAQMLIAHQLTAGAGGRGYGASPLSRGLSVLAKGRNLFETLLLNLVRYRQDDPIPATEEDCPIWERGSIEEVMDETPDGYLDYLTWQCRKLRLHSEDGFVRELSYGPGRMFRPKPESPVYDPMMAYQRRDDGDKALQLFETKALWRDSAALFQFAESDVFRGPRCLSWLANLRNEDYFTRQEPIQLAVIGQYAEQAKIFLWRHEEFPLPLAYLTDSDLVVWLKNALDLSEKVGGKLWTAASILARKSLAPGEMPADKNRVKAMVDALAPERLYWSRLEVPFRRFLERLAFPAAEQTPYRKREYDDWFNEILCPTARAAFDETAGRLDRSSRMLRAMVAGETQLRKSLGKIAKEANITSSIPQGVHP
jgi:CRISPR system Cascade subunit CasA